MTSIPVNLSKGDMIMIFEPGYYYYVLTADEYGTLQEAMDIYLAENPEAQSFLSDFGQSTDGYYQQGYDNQSSDGYYQQGYDNQAADGYYQQYYDQSYDGYYQQSYDNQASDGY